VTDPLFVDCYPGDGHMDWAAFVRAGAPWHGAVFKLSQGLKYEYSEWAYRQRAAFIVSKRYGEDLFDGFYHYLDIAADGVAQADWYCRLMANIGGEKIGTLWGMVDVERAGQRVPLTKSRVEDCLSAFAQKYKANTGRTATLYGGELLRAIGATGLYGCGRSAVACYTKELHGAGETTAQFLKRTGTDLGHLLFWQYCGDGEAQLASYPRAAPGCGAIDISALVLPGGLNALRSSLWAERPA
jgi:hypothetical protein